MKNTFYKLSLRISQLLLIHLVLGVNKQYVQRLDACKTAYPIATAFTQMMIGDEIIKILFFPDGI